MEKLNIWKRMGKHPQKVMLRFIAKYIYVLGVGNCWYEKKEGTVVQRSIYSTWSFIINLYMIVFIIDKCFAFYGTDLNVKDNNSLIQTSIGISTIYIKVVIFMIQRNHILLVLKKLLNDNRDIYTSINIERASVKKASIYIGVLVTMVYMSFALATLDGIKAHINEGVPIRLAITYYPKDHSTGKYINVLRFIVELHWWYIATVMFGVDALSYCSLIFVEHKFMLIQEYYKHLTINVLKNAKDKSEDELQEDIKKSFIAGIRLHESALWCATNVQSTLGIIYSVQVIQSIGLLVNGLIQFVTVERDSTFLAANMMFIFTMIYLTGSYMIPSGDITWEAGELSSAIYDCGWELTTGRHNRELRTLIVVAIQRSQVPVYMTAFGVLTLSYNNFISILRSSYSFFAVMY